jgi:hypothetical protein
MSQFKTEEFPYEFKETSFKIKTRGNQVFPGILLKAEGNKLLKFYQKNPELVTKNSVNQNKYQDALFTETKEKLQFTGGKLTDIFKAKDLKIVEKHQAVLTKTFPETFTQVKSRKKIASQYDGEWDFDKRFEISPFQKRENVVSTRRAIKINAEVSFSAYVSIETINNYGAFIVALVNFIEKKGTTVELVLTKTSCGAVQTKGREFIDKTEIKVKNYGEYLAKEEMLKFFSAVFFRRIGFTQIILASDYMKSDVDDALGMPFSYGSSFYFDKETGSLNIYSCPDIHTQGDIIETLKKELM